MMTNGLSKLVDELLGRLAGKGVRIEAHKGDLSLDLGRMILSDEERALLLREKQDVIAFLDGRMLTGTSATQERVWHLSQVGPPDQYHIAGAFKLFEGLDRRALGAAATQVANRHEALRASFAVMGGVVVQFIQPAVTIGCKLLDAEIATLFSCQNSLENAVRTYCAEPFNLAQSPLFRIGVVEESKAASILIVCLHHLVADERSVDLLIREISGAYAAIINGQRWQAKPQSVDYTAFVAWEKQRAVEGKLDRDLAYWEETLNGYTPPVLYGDFPPPKLLSGAGMEVSRNLPAALIDATRDYCARNGVTLFTLFASAVYCMLTRLTGQNDIVLGIPAEGRGSSDLRDIIGLFTTLAYLRVRPSTDGNLSVEELVRSVQNGILNAQDHASASYERRPGHGNQTEAHRLTSVFVNHVSHRRTSVRFGGYPAELLHVDFRVSKFELAFELVELNAETVCIRSSFSTDVFLPETIQRFCEQLGLVLTAMLRCGHERLASLDVTIPRERHMVLTDWSRGPVLATPEKAIHQYVSEQARRTPDNPAVILWDNSVLSYAELDHRSDNLAAILQECGVTPDTPVALYMERSFAMPIGALGILKAGGAYVPISPDDPCKRNRYMLQDSGSTIVVTQTKLKDEALRLLPGSRARILTIRDDGISETAPTNGPYAVASPDHLAYVIYTSGSTGAPKGVMIDHRAIANRLIWMQAEYQLTGEDRVLQKTPFTFDVSVWELFWPLMTGASLALAPPGDHREPLRLARLIRDLRITTLHFVPSMLAQFVSIDQITDYTRSVKHLFCSGEALGKDLAQQCLSSLTCGLHNLYGPTEAAVDVSYWACRAHYPACVPIGRPIANTRLLIMDDRRQPLGIGIPGELYIGGICLARGYTGKPDLTKERFIELPLDGCNRWYKSGDLARWLPDGNIEFLGRIDDQIKVNGHRVEPTEVEAILRTHPACADAAVIAEGSHLVAFVVPDSQYALSASRWCSAETAGARAGIASEELMNGLEIARFNRRETEFLYQEIFASNIYLRNGVRLAERSCVVDAGANIGLFSILVAALCPDSIIYAFEPIPAIHQVLTLNAQVYMPHAKLFQCALGRRQSEEDFTFYPLNTLLSTRYPDEERTRRLTEAHLRGDAADRMRLNGISGRQLKILANEVAHGEIHSCPVMTLSRVIAEHGIDRIDLLKVDVEGSELDVLNGIDTEDWERIDQIVVEVDDTYDRGAAVIALLRAQGYQVRAERQSRAELRDFHMVYARRSSDQFGEADARTLIPTRLPAHLQSRTALAAALRSFSASFLPDAMVPSEIVIVSALPRLPNCKIDRSALREQQRSRRAREDYAPPASEIEVLLAGIWKSVLSLDRVGVTDDFFENGGDSLKAMQVVVRAQQLGVSFDVRDLYRTRTIAALSQGAMDAPRTCTLPVLREGEFALTPIQDWFFRLPHRNINHWNQAAVFYLDPAISDTRLEDALNTLLLRHDIFRVRFNRQGNSWIQFFGGAPRLDVLKVINLSHLSEEQIAKELAVQNAAVQASLQLEDGHIFKVVRYRGGTGVRDRLFFCVHHLYIDNHSWMVLITELDVMLRAGSSSALPPQACSFQAWVCHLGNLAVRIENDERAYWHRIGEECRGIPPLLAAEPAESYQTNCVVRVPAETAGFIRRHWVAGSQATPRELWLTAVSLAFFKWSNIPQMRVFLEGHGRQPLAGELNLSSVVGWFTCLFPVVIPKGAATPAELLQTIQAILATLPNGGIGFQFCREDGLSSSRALSEPDLVFNYSGEIYPDLDPAAVLSPSNDLCGPSTSPDFIAPFISIDAADSNGMVSFAFSASRPLAERRRLEDFARSLEETVLELARMPPRSSPVDSTPIHRPAALPGYQTNVAGVTQPSFGPAFPIPLTSVHSSYPLSPMQKSFFLLDEVGRSSTYNARGAYRCIGTLNIQVLENAFRTLVGRHEALRTRFEFHMGEPRAFIQTCPDLDYSFSDISHSALDCQNQIGDLIRETLDRPFALATGRLLRVHIIKVHAEEHIICVCLPHIAVDRWSMRVLQKELVAAYVAGGSDIALPQLRIQYKDFAAWYVQLLETGQLQHHAEYWYDKLGGPLPVLQLPTDHHRPSLKSNQGSQMIVTLDARVTRGLREFASYSGASLFMCLLALVKTLLACYSRQEDIIVGVPVAGRLNAELESQVGLYVNVVALRDTVSSNDTFAGLLEKVKSTVFEAFEHQIYPFDNLIQELEMSVDLSRNLLFDVLVNLHNEDAINHSDGADALLSEVRFEEYDCGTRTSRFDLSFDFVEEGCSLRTYIEFASALFEETTITQLGEDLKTLCDEAIGNPSASINALFACMRGPLQGRSTFTTP